MQKIHQKLHLWYAQNGRHDLPWRKTEDPYHIYLSEVMLQQTQVKTVLERYYFPFLEKFPTLQALADAPLDEVLKMWEGLGYYTRAKNLHKAAQIAAPELPRTYDGLLALPGIGKNTASAICAFAYRQKRAVMEANVRRILCRLYVLDDPKEDELIQKANALLDNSNPFDYNQAMMDIGTMVCSLKNPFCCKCPFEEICQARALGCYDFPVKKSRKVPTRKEIVVVEFYQQKVKLIQREGRFLHGLWGFPSSDNAKGESIGEVRHQYTHFKLELSLFLFHCKEEKRNMFTREEIEDLALSTVDRKIVRLLEKRGLF
jgi:A/G-specific adenine glycosylase